MRTEDEQKLTGLREAGKRPAKPPACAKALPGTEGTWLTAEQQESWQDQHGRAAGTQAVWNLPWGTVIHRNGKKRETSVLRRQRAALRAPPTEAQLRVLVTWTVRPGEAKRETGHKLQTELPPPSVVLELLFLRCRVSV